MALEARHHNQFSPQIITNNREFVKIDETKLHNFVQMGCANPFTTTMENPWLGLNPQFLGMNNMMINQPQTNFVKPESGLPNNFPNGPRKRSRDSMEDQFNNFIIPPVTNNVPNQGFAPPSNFPYDVQNLGDIDHILSQFNKNIKQEYETQQERDLKFVLDSVTSKFVKRLKIQSEKFSRMAKLNMALQERMKSLYAETQLWKNVANTAEITAMSLRKDFENILGRFRIQDSLVEEDAESCCGSTDSGTNNQEIGHGTRTNSGFIDKKRMCKKCGERESSVLLLPCRHLCLCGVCGGNVQTTCPVCNSCMTATVHVCLT
ncbi:E3 ubiquitin-protein ligase BOI [Heracleum sosnowskyi]|uniref:E3 ubiquitin-protein ligase BOI n=1 Tax=Heracleum sosnowskyi TaxID=360622 RepID=A0AAD8HKU0_9APIA|nr:E3 ubiquitin-protein ligase BOI [Heracleum sosnowskyi]